MSHFLSSVSGQPFNEKLLTPVETAGLLNCEIKTLYAWSSAKRYDLPVVKVGRLNRYRLSDVMAFIKRHTQQAAEAN